MDERQQEILAHWDAWIYEKQEDEAEMAAYIVRKVGAKPQRVLEAGCGGGKLCVLLARAGHEVTGMDREESMLQFARTHAASLPNLRVRQGDIIAQAWGGEYDVAILGANLLVNLVTDRDSKREQKNLLERARRAAEGRAPVSGLRLSARRRQVDAGEPRVGLLRGHGRLGDLRQVCRRQRPGEQPQPDGHGQPALGDRARIRGAVHGLRGEILPLSHAGGNLRLAVQGGVHGGIPLRRIPRRGVRPRAQARGALGEKALRTGESAPEFFGFRGALRVGSGASRAAHNLPNPRNDPSPQTAERRSGVTAGLLGL